MAKDQIIYHVEKCYLYHLFVYKPVQPFYKGNQSKDFRVIMDQSRSSKATMKAAARDAKTFP